MAALDQLRDKWDGITPRERMLVVLLGVSFVVCLLLYVAFGISDKLDAMESQNARMRKAQAVLTERLAIESTEEFGDPQTADQILGTAGTAAPGAVNPLPKMTAWDILLDITERMPARDKITLDVDSIEIDAQKVLIKGTAKTPDEVDAIEGALKGQPCFTEVTRGALQTVADDKRQFEFSIKAACM